MCRALGFSLGHQSASGSSIESEPLLRGKTEEGFFCCCQTRPRLAHVAGPGHTDFVTDIHSWVMKTRRERLWAFKKKKSGAGT